MQLRADRCNPGVRTGGSHLGPGVIHLPEPLRSTSTAQYLSSCRSGAALCMQCDMILYMIQERLPTKHYPITDADPTTAVPEPVTSTPEKHMRWTDRPGQLSTHYPSYANFGAIRVCAPRIRPANCRSGAGAHTRGPHHHQPAQAAHHLPRCLGTHFRQHQKESTTTSPRHAGQHRGHPLFHQQLFPC